MPQGHRIRGLSSFPNHPPEPSPTVPMPWPPRSCAPTATSHQGSLLALLAMVGLLTDRSKALRPQLIQGIFRTAVQRASARYGQYSRSIQEVNGDPRGCIRPRPWAIPDRDSILVKTRKGLPIWGEMDPRHGVAVHDFRTPCDGFRGRRALCNARLLHGQTRLNEVAGKPGLQSSRVCWRTCGQRPTEDASSLRIRRPLAGVDG